MLRPVGRPAPRSKVRRPVSGRGRARAVGQRPVLTPTGGAPRTTSAWDAALSQRYGESSAPALRETYDYSVAGPSFRTKPKPKENDGYSVLGFLGNVAGDVKDIAQGILPGAWDIAKTVGQGTYGSTIGLIPGTGGGLARRSFNNNAARLADATWETVKQSGSNWGRVFTGDFRPLYEDGAFMALDLAALASAGGGAAVKGAQAARAAGRSKIKKVARDPRVVKEARRAGGARVDMSLLLDDIGDAKLSADYAAGAKRVQRYNKLADSRKLAARQRPNRVIDERIALPALNQLADQSGISLRELRDAGFEPGNVEVPQRPLARTPLARAIQRPLIAGIGKVVESNRVTKGLSDKRLASRLMNEAERGVREKAAERARDAGVLEFQKAMKDKEVRKDPLAKVAATLHLEGVLGRRKDLSPQQARDEAVRTATFELRRLKDDPEIDARSLEDAEQQVRYLQELPDELLTLDGDSPKVKAVRRVVQTARTYNDNLRKYDLYDLDEIGARDIRGERDTISQRILVGGARAFNYGGDATQKAKTTVRAMVPEVFMGMVREGEVVAKPGKPEARGQQLREILQDETSVVTGQLAYDFLGNTRFADQFRAARTPEQRLRFLEGVASGRARTIDGKAPSRRVRRSAQREIEALRAGARREGAISEQQNVVAYRVRDNDGNATKWVRSPDGEVPAALSRGRRNGDVLERAEVPARAWFNRQDNDGRVDRLPAKLEAGPVTAKDGRTFGVTRRTVWGRGDDPGAGDGPERFELERPRRDGMESVERVRAVVPDSVARQLDESNLSPGSRQAIVEFLEYGKNPKKVSRSKLVVRRLIELGLVDVKQAAREIGTGGFSQKAITEGIEKMLKGKLPLDKDGYVDLATLDKRLRTDRKLRDLWNAPELLSRVEILPGAYIQHRDASSFGGQPLLDARRRATTSAVSPEPRFQRTQGTLAKGLRYSLDPKELLATSTNLLRTVSNREFISQSLYFAASIERKVKNPVTGEMTTVREPLVYTGRQARSMDKSKWVAVPVDAFTRAEVWLRDWKPDGRGIDVDQVIMRLDAVSDSDKVYVFPKEFGDRLKYAWSNPSKFWRGYDNLMQMWRGGLLALAPRWYINNLVGNTVFYGFYTGFDGYSLRIARQIGDTAIPYRAYSDGFASQAYDQPGIPGAEGPDGKTKLGKKYFSVVEGGYRLNSAIEGTIRKAAYIHAIRKLLADEGLLEKGVRGKYGKRRANDVEMMEAIASAPDYLKREAVKEMERWMGDYRNLGKFERSTIRRALPFYSWIKVINTWLFGLPFRSPLRAELMAIAGQIGNELAGDRSYLPWWEQGRIEFSDSVALRTSGLNPFQSVIEPLLPLGTRGAGWDNTAIEMVASLGGQMSPVFQGAMGVATGRQTFGDRDFTAPTGYGGSVSAYGRDPQTYNTITNQLETRSRKGNTFDLVFQMVPGVTQLRDVVAAGRTPYNTSSTLDLVLDRLGVREGEPLYQPPAKNKSGRERFSTKAIGLPLSYLGAPVYKYDKEQEKRSDARRKYEFRKNQFLQQRLIRREQARRENG